MRPTRSREDYQYIEAAQRRSWLTKGAWLLDRRRRSNRILFSAAGIGAIAGVGLAGVLASIDSDTPSPTDLPPVERFTDEYIDKGDCLHASAYDVESGHRGRASVTPPSATYNVQTGILTITPVGGQNPLHVEGFNQNQYEVTPVAAQDQAIFDSYNCEPEKY